MVKHCRKPISTILLDAQLTTRPWAMAHIATSLRTVHAQFICAVAKQSAPAVASLRTRNFASQPLPTKLGAPVTTLTKTIFTARGNWLFRKLVHNNGDYKHATAPATLWPQQTKILPAFCAGNLHSSPAQRSTSENTFSFSLASYRTCTHCTSQHTRQNPSLRNSNTKLPRSGLFGRRNSAQKRPISVGGLKQQQPRKFSRSASSGPRNPAACPARAQKITATKPRISKAQKASQPRSLSSTNSAT